MNKETVLEHFKSWRPCSRKERLLSVSGACTALRGITILSHSSYSYKIMSYSRKIMSSPSFPPTHKIPHIAAFPQHSQPIYIYTLTRVPGSHKGCEHMFWKLGTLKVPGPSLLLPFGSLRRVVRCFSICAAAPCSHKSMGARIGIQQALRRRGLTGRGLSAALTRRPAFRTSLRPNFLRRQRRQGASSDERTAADLGLYCSGTRHRTPCSLACRPAPPTA